MAKSKAKAKPAAQSFGMVDLFSKTEPTVSKKASKPKGTQWVIPSDRQDLQESLHQFIGLTSELKTTQAKIKVYKDQLSEWAFGRYVEQVAANVKPGTPMKVLDDTGANATFVVQDRSATAEVSDEQLQEIAALVEDIDQVVQDRVEFGLNADLLQIAAVRDRVNQALVGVLQGLVEDEVLSPAQAQSFVVCKSYRGLRPRVIDNVVGLVGNSVDAVGSFFRILGSALTYYVKV